MTCSPTYQKGFETDRILRPVMVWPRRPVKVERSEAIVDLVGAGQGVSGAQRVLRGGSGGTRFLARPLAGKPR